MQSSTFILAFALCTFIDRKLVGRMLKAANTEGQVTLRSR